MDIRVGPHDHDASQKGGTVALRAPDAGAGPMVTNGHETDIDFDDPTVWDVIAEELLRREFDRLQDLLRAFKEKHAQAVDAQLLDDAIKAILENDKDDGALAQYFEIAVNWPSYVVVLTTYLYAAVLEALGRHV